MELEQSRKDQKDYLRQVELARVLKKRGDKKRKAAEEKGESIRDEDLLPAPRKKLRQQTEDSKGQRPREMKGEGAGTRSRDAGQLDVVLGSIF